MEKDASRFKLAGTATVGPKGQVVIPAEIRQDMDIQAGDKLIAIYVAQKKSIAFITEKQAQNFIDKMGAQVDNLKDILKK